jgi:hypothetical protein
MSNVAWAWVFTDTVMANTTGKTNAQHPGEHLLSLPETGSESLYKWYKGYNETPWKV